MKRILFFLLTILIFSNCEEPDSTENLVVGGLKPIYLSLDDLSLAASKPAKSFGVLGKIFSTGDLIFINEQYAGIHVIDNTNPLNPITKHFWAIPGYIDFTLHGNFLYADNSRDLLTIDISNPADIKMTNRIENIHSQFELSFPNDYFGFFECIDNSKGIVIGWEESSLTNPKCRR